MSEITRQEEEDLRVLSCKENLTDIERQRHDQLACKYLSSRETEFLEKFIKPFCPNFRIGRSSSSGSINTYYRGTTLEVSTSNEIFKDSQYYFEPKKSQRLVHFTSYSNLKAILKSQCLWLKPLDSMEDPNEMFTLAQNLGFGKKEITDYQEDYYSASFNLFENDNCEEWIFWKMYGKDRKDCLDGTGAALEFTIEDQEISKWRSFHCSEIHYDSKLQMLEGLKKDAQDWMSNREFRIRNLSEIFLKLMSFYKDKMWGFEKEIRILFDNGDYANENSLIKAKEDSFGRRVELPLGRKLDNQNQDYIEKGYEEGVNFNPQLKLSSIILGPKIKDFSNRKEEIEELSKNNFTDAVKVRKSKFYDYFNA